MNRPTRFLATFAAASVLMTALSVATARDWRPATQLPALEPAPEQRLSAVEPLAITQTPVAVPGADDEGAGAAAWIVRPVAGGPDRPGVVLVHGAGPGSRDSLLVEARALAAAGVVAIGYDKRGGWSAVWDRDFSALAHDALRAAELLRAAPGVDPTQVGLLGFSEGGWVVSEAVRRAPAVVAFVALVSAPVVTPADQLQWQLEHAVPGLPAWLDQTAATTLGAGAKLQPWVGYDSTAGLAAMRVPVVGYWGADDATVPVNAAVRRIRDVVPGPTSLHVVAGAGHQLPVSSGYLDRAARWILAGGAGVDEGRGVEPASAAGVAVLARTSVVAHPLVQILTCLALATAAACWRPTRRQTVRGVSA